MDLDFLQSLMGGEEVAESASYQDLWVIGETAGGEPTPLTIAIVGKARELANALGAYVKTVLFGPGQSAAGETLIRYGADEVILLEDPALTDFALEPYVAALAEQIEAGRPEIVLFGATSLGGELGPRLAARFGGPFLGQCIDLRIDEIQRALQATVPRLGGEYYEIVTAPAARPQFATIPAGVLPRPFADDSRSGAVETAFPAALPAPAVQPLGPFIGQLPPVPLKDARVIVCVGRGLEDDEGLKLASELAARLGGQVAGTRGAFDAGWVCEDRVIGMGGVSVRPALYIGCGVAGAIQHVVAMDKAGFVVAINRDPTAEIFQAADMGIVADAKEALQALLAALE